MAQKAILDSDPVPVEIVTEVRREEALLKAGALQNAIFNSANFSSIATDEKGVIQIFNVGAERMLGYTAAEVLNKITPAEISDAQEAIARAKALSQELGTNIAPGFEALVFKASRGIEDVYELTYIRKDGSRFPAVVSVTALRDGQGGIIGYLLIGTDNTARKQIEAEQKKLDQRRRDQQFYTRSLVESNIDALMTTDPLGIITDVNKQMEALTGCTRDELIGAPFKSYFTDPERAEAGIKLVLSEKKVTNYELTAYARDGKKKVVSYDATTFYDRDRRLQGVFAAARDVTERKQADEELQRANAKLKAWAQALNSFAIVAETDTQGRITYANDPFCRISKHSREELLGKDHREVVNSGYHSKAFWTEMWSTISRGQIWRGEIKNRAKDGTVYWVDTAIVPLLGANGGPETYLAIHFVITERKVAEELIRTSSAYARSLIEASLDPLVTISSEGKITDVNEASVQATGVRREQLIATDFSDYFTEPDKARAGYQKVFSEGFVRDYPLAIRHITSRITDVLYNASVYKDDQGKVLGVFAAARDVTEHKRFEQALQETNVKLESAKSAAEKANLAKSDFLSSMSHELRTPLNSIIGFSEILADKTFGDLNDRQLKYSNNILNSGRHLLQLINDILDLAKVEAGRVDLTRHTFSVSKALSEVQTIVKTLANKKNIGLEFEAASDLPSLFADEAKFKQIMYNLLSNAIKFTPNAGKVFVTAAIQTATSGGSSPPGESLRVAVADTGIGIKVNDQERVFKEFEQVDSSYGRQQQGTGLGLALTKRLVEMHGGRIWVESEGVGGKGSTFTFLIPIPKAEAKPAQLTDTPDSRDDTIRPLVLVVTNDDSHQCLVGHYLTGVGYEVAVVSETAAMIAALKARRPYAVVIDRKMGSAGDWPGGEGQPPEQPQSDFSDTLMQHKCRSSIPAGIPQVIFSEDENGRLAFSLLGMEGAVPERVSSRLVDAIRQSDKTTGKELKTILIIDDDPALLELLTMTLLQEGFRVLRASHGRAGVEFATNYLPEVIILDFSMPEFDGIQIVEQLRAHPRTKDIPILINTGAVLNEEERQRLAGHVQSITSKTERESLLTELERLSALSDEARGTGANL